MTTFAATAAAALVIGSVVRFGFGEPAAFVAAASAVLVPLSVVDFQQHRLPNVIVVPAIAGATLWVLALGAAKGSWDVTLTALVCGVGFFAFLFVLALISGGIGFGDVKLAAFIGLFAGRFGTGVAFAAVLAGFLVGGVAATVLLATRRRGRKEALPFGPALAAGALAAVFLGESSVRAWLGL
jgi:leader peptidase (prepilin peptidase) / N-methyltransferase